MTGEKTDVEVPGVVSKTFLESEVTLHVALQLSS